MKKKRLLTLVCLLAAVGIGAVIYSQAAESNAFDPDSYAKDMGMQNNQAYFHDDAPQSGGEEQADEDSRLWEQQDDEDTGLQQAEDASWLFETQKRLTDAAEGTPVAAMTAQEDAQTPSEQEETDGGQPQTLLSANTSLQTAQPAVSASPVVLLTEDGQTVLRAANAGSVQVSGTGTQNAPETQSPVKTEMPDLVQSAAPQETELPPVTAEPVPTDTEMPTVLPTLTPIPTETPPTPAADVVEPDPTPTLPADVYEQIGLEIPAFPQEGVAGTAGDNKTYSLLVLTDWTDLPKVYIGQQLDAWTLLCSIYAYVYEDGIPAYRLQECNENFVLEDYPETVTGDFTFTVRFRPNAQSDWITETVEMQTVPYKVTVKGTDGEILADHYPAEGETIDLTRYYEYMQPAECIDIFGDGAAVTELFMGWSVSSGGTASCAFTPVRPGKTVLTPLPKEPVPDGYTVKMQWGMDFDSPYFGNYLQTLTAYEGTEDTLTVPEGIQQVSVGGSYQEIILPASVLVFDAEAFGFACAQRYETAEDNPCYATFMGMLTDKELTKLYAIPDAVTKVTVPETVDSVALQWGNAITEMHFISKMPPELSLSLLDGATLYVPSEAYLDYLLAWNGSLGTNELKTEGSGDADYLLEDELILSADRSKLYGMTSENKGFVILPDTVCEVTEGGLGGSLSVQSVVLPASVERLGENITEGGVLRRILFTGETPPEITGTTFAQEESPEVYVPAGTRDDYVRAWGEVIGEERAEQMLAEETAEIKTCGGCTFWSQGDNDILVAVSETLTRFDSSITADAELNLTEIGAYAFGGCGCLTVVSLPESVVSIGANAFAGCSALELLLVKTTQPLHVGYGAFDGCSGLRAMALNSASAVFEDGYEPYVANAYVPAGAEGYPWCFSIYDCRYYFVEQGEATLLFGEDDPSALNDWQTAHFVRGVTSNVSGEIALEENTQEIGSGVFQFCTQAFTIPDEQLACVGYIGDYAFAYSGFIGSPVFDSVRRIDNYAFCCCYGLEQITFSDRLEVIGDGAFYACSSLNRLVLPPYVQSIGMSVVDECAALTGLEVQGLTPPALVRLSVGFGYAFGYTLPEDFAVYVPKDSLETYIDVWRYYFAGYEPGDEVDETMLSEAEAVVRALLRTADAEMIRGD